MYTDETLKNLPDDINSAGKILCDLLINKHRTYSTVHQRLGFYQGYVNAFAIFEAILMSKNYPFKSPIFTDSKDKNINAIYNFFSAMSEEFEKKITANTIDAAREKYRIIYDAKFSYKFSDGDLKRIQDLILELKENITNSEVLDINHKKRLYEKLEGLEKELHKKMESLDKLYGLIGDAGVVLEKYGKDARPIADRIREIAQITWQTQARSEELPTGIELQLLNSGKNE